MIPTFGFLPQIGPLEFLIIALFVVIFVLGPKRVPAAARSIGKGFKNLKNELGTGDDDEDPAEIKRAEQREKSKSGS